MTANIFDIYRGTTHDGPGIRDTVFFKGCPLNCQWCHNPEGISFGQQVWWESSKCIGCSLCVQSCPQQAILATAHGLIIDQNKCISCLSCTQVCPSKAMMPIGKTYTVSALSEKLKKDKSYFEQFGGGITASGGECLMQSSFVAELFHELQAVGITTAIDTSGEVPYSAFKEVMPHTNYVLYDLKLFDSSSHKLLTGKDNHRILQNFLQLVDDLEHGKYHASIWVRTPLIPGATATADNIEAIATFLLPFLGKTVSRWEMCAFNNACTPKYRKLQKDWKYATSKLLNETDATELRNIAIRSGCDPDRVFLTGIMT